MSDEILEKQPTESDLFDIDFSPKLATGDTVTGVTSVTTAQAGLTIGAPALSTPLVQVRISGGTDGILYKITALVTTANGNTLETDVFLRVEER